MCGEVVKGVFERKKKKGRVVDKSIIIFTICTSMKNIKNVHVFTAFVQVSVQQQLLLLL